MRLTLLFASAVLLSAAEPVTFLRDVAPILNKAGCTSGPCHGAAKGKNGFKLSLRGYDPQYDYQSLLYDLSGRRFNRAQPEQSLMLAKPAQQIPHGGGLRFDADSAYYKTIYNWIAQGVPYGDPAKDAVTSIAVSPALVAMPKPGEKAQISVIAKFADGLSRDVTKEATVESNTPDVAKIDTATARVSGERIGEATLLVRYQGKYATIPVTILNPQPGFVAKKLPQYNYIDRHVDDKLARIKVEASPLVDDATFLRRVTLDLTGQLPTPEDVKAFTADPTPTRVKRSKRIDKLIASPAYADHWTVKWGDLLQSSRKFLGEKGTFGFREWIHEGIATNKPYDKMVRELLVSKGSSYDDPAANYFRTTREPKPTMEKTTQVFLGVRMVCAQCHDHPFEKWTQNQYYQMSAFFSAVGLRPGYEVGEEIIYDTRNDYEMKHPKDSHVVAPEFLVASTAKINIPSNQRRRDALAEWLVSKDNPFFAKAMANRTWSYFFGKGIIDPVDDIRASNPPSNPALLDALTKDFIDHNFDLQHLMRTIVNSRVYQTAITTNEWNAKDTDNFSHAAPRRLGSEQLMDAVTMAAGVRPKFPELPEDTMASQLPDPHVGRDGFLDLFGRPTRESACECERRADFSLPQALNLVNGTTISDAVADPKGRVAKMVLAGKSDTAMIEELYLATLSRVPTKAESDAGVKYLAGGARATRAQDLLWALLNSKGFLYSY
ncbi:DUF1549 and DUF1553 domain-containing protein [Bryobacter aggregatus]|uniref:DUF1549 and DUF1553 domain-containing protein n=1 Tax=Bryobacter aggregatus TaxID=360054 RepID=UPI00068B3A12|nr:DUF1549 and DUF1553 domain-containing protein [Bryobacter aggregatus]